MSQLEELSVFVRVTEAGGVGKAAEQLGIAKSAVSRRLAELEKRLGVRLINRTTRSSRLTEAGERCYQHALRVLDVVNELNLEVAEQHCEQPAALSGKLRLSAPLSFGMHRLVPLSFSMHRLVPLIDQFQRRHPNVSLDLDLTDRFVDLISSGLDLAIRIGELKDSTYQARRLTAIETYLVASPRYLAQAGRPQTPTDLENHKLLVFDRTTGSTVMLSTADGKSQTVQMHSSVSANNGDFLHQLALRGHGILLSPDFISGEALGSGELERVLPDYRTFSRNVYAVYPQTRFVPRHVRAFIDYIAEHLPQYGPNS